MSYAVVWAPEAEADLARLEPLEASYVLDQIDQLAANPGPLCLPPGLPHRQNEWKFQFYGQGDYDDCFYAVLFEWGKDGRTLILTGIGVVRY